MAKNSETRKRIRTLCAEAETTEDDLAVYIKEELNRRGIAHSVQQIRVQLKSYLRLPSAGILILMAERLHTSVGYIIAEHDMREYAVTKTDLIVNPIRTAEEYKQIYKETLFSEADISRSWAQKYRNRACTGAPSQPFVEMARVTGFSIDHCLGVMEEKYWEEYAFSHGLYAYLPQNTLIYLPENDLTQEMYALLSSDKTQIVLKTGEMLPLEMIEKLGGQLIMRTITSHGERLPELTFSTTEET